MRWFLAIGCLLAIEPWQAHADAREEAHQHYEAGVIAFDASRFADAAAEFERAYALVPAWQVLYNLGAVYAALGRPTQALSALTRYLEQADASLDAARRSQVESEITLQRAKTGLLEVHVDREHARVSVDGEAVGDSPLREPVRLAAGTHTVEARIGRQGTRRKAQVVAGDYGRLELTLANDVAVDLSAVHAAPSTATSLRLEPHDADSGAVQRVLGYSLGAIGLIGVAVGGTVAGVGQANHNDAVALAQGGMWPAARELEGHADRQKATGFATLGLGAVLAATGVVLIFTASPASVPASTAWRLSGLAKASSAGATVGRSW